jgi:hypothetical protein
MDRDDVAGAQAAARYFIELTPHAYATGDVADWRQLSDSQCMFCWSAIGAVEALHESGGHGVGPEITVLESYGTEPVPGNEYYSVDLLIEEGPSGELSDTGEELHRTAGGQRLLLYAIQFTSGGWRVRGVQVENADETP